MFFEIKNLFISLKNFSIKNISLSIEKNDYLCIIGPTGAGKTIILESIIGFHKINKGKIFLENKEITELAPEKRKIGIIYQDYSLFPHFTVKKNISYGLNEKSEQKIIEICETLEISHLLERYPNTLSGGEQQRVALARALVVEPSLLLMDEPFSALDNQTKFKTRQLIRDIVKKLKITVIHITHDLDDVWALATKVAIIKEGRLTQFGTTNQIMNKPKSEFVAEFIGTNVLEGKIIKKSNNLTTIQAGNFIISSIDEAPLNLKVKFAIRPENIIIFKEKPVDLSARNVITAKLADFYIEGKLCYLFLNIGETKLKALLTINAFEDLELKIGDKLFAIIKATNVRII